MAKIKQGVGIQASLVLVRKSTSRFAPVKEGIMNALDSITQRRNRGDEFKPSVSVSFVYSSDALADGISFSSVLIEDNGIGFIRENIERLKNLGDRSKNLNNRGTGKLQFFHRFKSIAIDSTYQEAGEFVRKQICYLDTDEFTETCRDVDKRDYFTSIALRDFHGTLDEREFWNGFYDNPQRLKKEILKVLLLRLFLERGSGLVININVIKEGQTSYSETLSGNNIPQPDKEEEISIPYVRMLNGEDHKSFKWIPVDEVAKLAIRRFKLPAEEIDTNEIFLCSKNVLVKTFDFPLLKNKAQVHGFRFHTCISGDILDDPNNVNHAVDGFQFKWKKDVDSDCSTYRDFLYENESFIFWEDIEHAVTETLGRLYSDVKEVKADQIQNVQQIAERFGISKEIAEGVRIGINENTKVITEKLFAAQAKMHAEKSMEIQAKYDELSEQEIKKLNPLDKNYKVNLLSSAHKLLNLICQQDKDELARYIIRRDMMVRLLKLILLGESRIQAEWRKQEEGGDRIRKDKEGLIHDLLFKRKGIGDSEYLWILNEEFVHFSGCSDVALDHLEINGKRVLKSDCEIDAMMASVGLRKDERFSRRPDIFLYPEEGKCILIEFKAPDVDMTNHLDQITKYAKLLANFAAQPITQFYGYLIGESVSRIDVPDRYTMATYGQYWFEAYEIIRDLNSDKQIAGIYKEIIPLSTIAHRAELRNCGFAQKLGIDTSKLQSK